MLDKDKIKEYCTQEFLIPFEGTGPKDSQGNFLAYLCPANVPTIAWGLTFDENGNKVKLGDVWSYEKALKAKSSVLDSFLKSLLDASPILSTETEERVAAILSWCYNLGISNYKASTFKKRVDIRDWVQAASECKKWDKAKVNGESVQLKGLTIRRAKEADTILVG